MSRSHELKAITVQQPWAWAIVMGYKDVDNRRRRSERRGTILVHAGLKMDPNGFLFLWRLGLHKKLPARLPLGALVGEVKITDCRYGVESDWSVPGCWQLVLSGAREFRSPLTCQGAQGFFSPDVSAASLGQVRRHAIAHRTR